MDKAGRSLERNWHISTATCRTELTDGPSGRSWQRCSGCYCSVTTRSTKVSHPTHAPREQQVCMVGPCWEPNPWSVHGAFQGTCDAPSQRHASTPPPPAQRTRCTGWPCARPWSRCCPEPGQTWAMTCRITSRNPSVTSRISCWMSVSPKVASPVSNRTRSKMNITNHRFTRDGAVQLDWFTAL